MVLNRGLFKATPESGAKTWVPNSREGSRGRLKLVVSRASPSVADRRREGAGSFSRRDENDFRDERNDTRRSIHGDPSPP